MDGRKTFINLDNVARLEQFENWSRVVFVGGEQNTVDVTESNQSILRTQEFDSA
tara:strand:- start:51 stop:212 length:162 start_codon:yes stop_codon:yes gene_type:complete